MLNPWLIFINLTINDPLPFLPGNEQDLGHENSQHLLVLPSVQRA